MLENKFKSNLLKISVDISKQYLEVIINKDTKKMTEERYKEETKIWADIIEKYKPKYHLLEGTNMLFLLDPELQEWTVKNLLHILFRVGVEKFAFVLSKDKVVSISQQMTVDIIHTNKMLIEYFDSYQSAKQWLIEA